MELARRVYPATAAMAWPHRQELGGQMRKAAVSVPSNIAEGFRQGADGAFLRHLKIAAGSTAELETQAQLAIELRLWTDDAARGIPELTGRTAQMLAALIRAIDARKKARSTRSGRADRHSVR